jgi:endonuclease YncB( thermonuclease family)
MSRFKGQPRTTRINLLIVAGLIVLCSGAAGVVSLWPDAIVTPQPTWVTTPTAALLPSPVQSPALGRTEAMVVRIVDGDTVEVSIDGQPFKLRYIGINTPETDEPFGSEATAVNSQLVEGKMVYLEKDTSEVDRYDRLLRYVYLADGTFINAELVRLGYARAVAYPPDTKDRALFEALEREAQQARRGLWAATPAVEPSATVAPPAGESGVSIVTVFNSGKQEYVEIANTGTASRDLGGWSVSGSSGDERYTFPAGYVLAAGVRVRLFSGAGGVNAPPGDIYWTHSSVWNNAGETATLWDAQGRLVSEYTY